jgi:hypothetical protein
MNEPHLQDGLNIRDTNELAKAVNGYNARVTAAVDSLLAHAARWAIALVGGCFLAAYLLGLLEQHL